MLLYLFTTVALSNSRKNKKLHSSRIRFYYALKGRKFSNHSRVSGKVSEGYSQGLLDRFEHEWMAKESAFTIEDSAENEIDKFFEAHKEIILEWKKFRLKD